MINTTSAPSSSVSIYPTSMTDGIYVYNRDDYNNWFESEYSQNAEPWTYSHRGADYTGICTPYSN